MEKNLATDYINRGENINYSPDLSAFHDLILNNKEWLMNKIFNYSKLYDYYKHTSTPIETWCFSISVLTDYLIQDVEIGISSLELNPDDDYLFDPVSSFGMIEAKRHHERGVDLSVFLGLIKYYRQSYLDLVKCSDFREDFSQECLMIIERFFHRFEIGFCVEWATLTENKKTKELRFKNRNITNEKNKYLTIFETMQDPVILLDKDNNIEDVNHAWSELFSDRAFPGTPYDDQNTTETQAYWFVNELLCSTDSSKEVNVFEKEIETKKGPRYFQIKIKRMLEINDEYRGMVVILNDITDLKLAEDEKIRKEKLQGVLEMAGAVSHEINQPLQVVMGQSQLLEMDMSKRSPFYKRILTIVNQIEKMGIMTKKLTNITRYETKAYLDSRIIDIDKASERDVIN